MLERALELQDRTRKFAVRVVVHCRKFPNRDELRVVSHQLVKSATSVAANYRSTCRARSRAEFIAKMGIVVEEADETVFWLELVREVFPREDHDPLLREARELLAIFSSSQRTLRRNTKMRK